MSTGLDHQIAAGRSGWTGAGSPKWAKAWRARFSRTGLVLGLLALLAAAGGWLVMPGSRGGIAESEPASSPMVESARLAAAYDAFTSEAIAPQQPTPLDRLKLYGQYWHRGGLGSNAQVSFTLRNSNDYAVKDVAIACDFVRQDGRHLTDRTRLVPGVIEMRSRKSFERLHIGFVNVNASKARCTLVSASRT